MDLIRIFTEITKDDVTLAGGKGASLGEMTQAGIPVPQGFVLLSEAFERFIEETNLSAEIDSLLHKVKHEEMHTVERASEQIQALILQSQMPKDIANEVKKHFKILGAKYVAVRSSATAEDSSTAAWAGQLDSYLNTTEEKLLEHVQRCWASLFTPRAIFYRFEKDLHKTNISVAVVVQKMINSEISGIAFSVHPVTQDYNQLIIEAGFGLGEAIVSGTITPDSYVVEKQPRRILEKNIVEQKRGLYRKEQGGNEWHERILNGHQQKLSDAQILEITAIVLTIEDHYGFPCDIEWAFEKGKFYITQSRPITTLIGTKPTDKKESYVFICRFKELPYLISDLFMQGYAKHKPYYCYVNGFWYSYFTKESYELALDEGLTKIKKDGWIKNFEFEYKSLVNKSSDFKIDLDKTKKLTKSKINEFFDYLKLLLQYYYPLDHFFTDKAFAESEKNKSLRPAVNKMGELKNFFREKLNEIVLYPNNMTQQYLQRISENYNVPFESLYLYSAEEIGKIPEGFRLSRKEIQGRSTKYAMYYDGEKSHYYSEKEADKIIEEIHEEPISDNVLKGIPANKGKITAKARVLEYTLNTLKDFGKIENLIKSMQKGEILVTETTGPEIMKACNKAIAIITDEGGLLSHAAIIARELKIPCIVGTKFATSTIKTGDLIEVDANKGIIKILKKNETEKKFFFEKEVTRDLALLAIEGFGPALINIYNKLKGIYPTSPFMIFYTKALLVEEWVDSDLLKEFVELIYLENLKGSIFLEQYIVNYKKHLDFYKDTNITSLKELQKYLHSLYFALESFIIFYFTAGDNRTPKPILQLAKQIRNTDNLGEVSDKVVRSALKNIFPHTTGYETVISSNDLSNMPTINVLKERAKQFLFIPGKFAETISLQDFSHNHPEYHFHIETPPADSSMLTGQIGNKGYVKGKVRIVNRKKEIDSVQDGEILVSTMTTPDFLPAMQKAAAFITDEGGITCHAAIMAREFNKPCIIGTKFATQILKDGDMVEVDADNGIVKILEKETNKTIFDPTTIDWFKVMERKNLFFVGLAFTDVETEKFKQVCGFQLQRYLFKYEKGMWSTYRGIQEHSELYNYFSQLIKKRDKRLFEFAKQAKKFNDLAKKYISAYSLNKNVKIDNYEKEYNLYCDTLLYGVTIPWAVLGAFETMTPTERKIYSDILNLYEPFRAESLYPDFEKRILQKYRVALSKRYNLDINLLYLLTPWELKNALKGIFIPRKEILKKRNEYCIYWFNPITKEIIFSHDKSIEKKITILQKASVENAEIIKGTVAYPGIVSGNVRIIYEAIDCADFKQNEILVSPSTNPTLMPAIKKCAGIITDEGGMTSHAAIIARELKKPCIIGTRIATQILKDGMEVEVDADNGIVRILSENSKVDEIKYEKIILSQYMNREHSLFYAHVWNEANRDLFDSFVKGTNIKNMVFVLNKLGILEVYYDLNQLEEVFNKIAQRLIENPKLLEEIISNFYKYWKQLFPYVEKKKKIKNLKELKKYYHNWISWWASMAYLFVIPDRTNIPQNLKKKALKVRVETQQYSDDGDRIFLEFIKEKYPKYFDIAHLITPEEAFRLDSLSTKEVEIIKERKKGCALITLHGKSKLIKSVDLEAEAKKQNISFEIVKQEKTDELRGLAASPGAAKGPVRLVLKKADLALVKKGDIMITYATSPDYVPAMKKCVAVITDEGGVVCHAAIVCRELGLPCIVGTKNATKILKDGDLVEIDADNGIIKILKRTT